MKKILLLSFTLLCASTFAASAQTDYKQAAGLRMGYTSGISGKYALTSAHLLEGIVGFSSYGARVYALYELYGKALFAPDLNWFFGAGAHVGAYAARYSNSGGAAFGIDGILGLEYSIPGMPLHVGIDWKPSLEFVNGYGPGWADAALSLRYVW